MIDAEDIVGIVAAIAMLILIVFIVWHEVKTGTKGLFFSTFTGHQELSTFRGQPALGALLLTLAMLYFALEMLLGYFILHNFNHYNHRGLIAGAFICVLFGIACLRRN